MLALGLGLAVMRALRGPIDVPQIARFLEEQMAGRGIALSAGNAMVDFSSGDGLVLVLDDMVIGDEEKDGFGVIVPRLSAPIDISAALTGTLRVSSLLLERPSLSVVAREPGENTPDVSMLVEAADRLSVLAARELDRRNLTKIELVDSDFKLVTGATRVFSGVDITLTRSTDDGLAIKAEIPGRLGRWRADATRTVDEESGESYIVVATSGITAAEFMPENAVLSPGRGLGVPIYPRFEARLKADGTFESARFGANIAGGWIKTGRSAISFDEINIRLAWEPGTDGFRIEPSRYVRGNTIIPFEGLVEGPREWQSTWSYRILSKGATLLPNDVQGPPMAVESILFEGRVDPGTKTIDIDRALLRAGTAKLDASGSIELRDDGPYVALALESGPMPVASVKRLWPITLAPPARAWVIEHLLNGRINSGKATLALRPSTFDPLNLAPGWAGDDVQVTIDYSDMSLSTIGTVPIIQGLSGTIGVDDAIMTIRGQEGVMVPSEGERVTIRDAAFSISELNVIKVRDGSLSLSLEGNTQDLGSILNSEPFAALARRDIAAADLSGTGEVMLTADFPLMKNLPIAKVNWRLEGKLKAFSLAKPLGGREIRDANLAFIADPRKIEVNGKGKLNGLTADIAIVEPLGNAAAGDQVLATKGILLQVTGKELASLGLDLGSLVKGPMEVAYDQNGDTQKYNVDLTQTRIGLDMLGWEKSPGVKATASFDLVKSENGQDLKNFTLASEGVDIHGDIRLTQSGELKEARFDSFKLRPTDTASLIITKSGKDGFNVDLRAVQLDGRGFISSLRKNAAGDEKKSSKTGVRVKAVVDLLIGFNGVSASDVNIEATQSGGSLQTLDLKGKTGGKNAFEVTLQKDKGGKSLTGNLANTGEAFKFLDLYKRMRGGRGKLSITMPEEKDWLGQFNVDNLSITGDPAIQKLGAITNYTDKSEQIVRNVGAVSRGEASFQTMHIEFRRRGDVLTITDGAMSGPTIGGTFSGTADLATQSLDLTGTFVPIFALNNLFAKIPLLGFALGGGTDEGLIGVTYRVSGSLTSPEFTVNPVSAIAPGIFRKLFEYK